ncbi:HEAT repeat domain-containing protein [Acanthopleuribacter pedis]|uniref:HEAT repeat domain-containing protein n=1 Tax=Acanthopleuribacter pedis TaxID=442870 RepID=A0A8J7QCV9_9BACT|nr:hypothetical protein [Acanthopleuribacter pedis]MBO1318686.1 hypothetical protein [Acanthopleuribacter pedis]
MSKTNEYQQHLERLEKEENLSPQDRKFKAHIDCSRVKYRAAARDLLHELGGKGFQISVIKELRESKVKYLEAIPILIKWLPRVTYRPLKKDIVRTLSQPWAKLSAEVLIDEFKNSTSEEDKNYRWIVGDALVPVVRKNHFNQLAEIVRDRSAGFTRQMVMVALGKTKHPKAAEVLMEVLQAGDEVGHAMDGLRRLKAKVPRELIMPQLTHEFPWVRKEAKKLLALQDKLDAAET